MPETTEQSATRSQMRLRQGIVAGSSAEKTIRVNITYQTKHPKYGKYINRSTNLQAHDENNEAKVGDTVEIAECRPLSKHKHHRLVRIIERGPDNR